MSAQQSPFPDRETVAAKFSGMSEQDKSFLNLLMENPVQDDALLEGLQLYIHQASEARFLNSLKLQQAGEWTGNNAPARLQIRLMEVARSSQHPAYQAFRTGLQKSGGLERAYPKASV